MRYAPEWIDKEVRVRAVHSRGDDRSIRGRYVETAALALALVLRVGPLFLRLAQGDGLPRYHSGGLFYAFSVAIRSNGFRLPAHIPYYTYGGLPFVYPPLAFYVIALLEQLLDVGPTVILYVNALLSFASVVILARALRHSELTGWPRLTALAAFATLPQGLTEYLSGEGLAETAGTTCFVLFLWAFWRFGAEPGWQRALWLGGAVALCVLASPGTALAIPVAMCIAVPFIWQAYSRQIGWPRLLLYLAAAAGFSLVVAGPYLAHLFGTYGVERLTAALGGQQHSHGASPVLGVAHTLVPRQWGLPAWNVLALAGAAYALIKKQPVWPAWLLLTSLIPREGLWLSCVPVSVLAGYGVCYADAFARAILSEGPSWLRSNAVAALSRLAAGCLAAYAALVVPFTALFGTGTMPDVSYVTPGEADYLTSLRESVDPDALLLIVGDENEWAPLLSLRTVLNVEYGTEWEPAKREAIQELNRAIAPVRNAQALFDVVCSASDRHVRHLSPPDLYYFSKVNERERRNPIVAPALLEGMRDSDQFELIYEDEHVLVFAPRASCHP